MTAMLRIRQHVARCRIGTGERWLRNASQLLSFSLFCLMLGQALFGQSPRIDSIDPAQGPIAGGTVVTITGANFQGATLSVDKVAVTPQAISATAIKFVTAPHDNGIASLKVATSAGAAYGEFLYVPPRLQDLPPGYITTVAGIGSFTGFYRQATQAEISPFCSPAIDLQGNIYVLETQYNRVVRIRTDGMLELFAGNGIPDYESPNGIGDGGPAVDASLTNSKGVTTDADGNVYITEFRGRIRKVDGRTGIISTIAGNGTRGYSGDGGPALQASLYQSTQLTGDGHGTLYFMDFNDATSVALIRKITPQGIISTVAGQAQGTPGFSGDGGPATQAQMNLIYGDEGSLALDSAGNLFLADSGNNRIRRVDGRTGIITTVYGPANIGGGGVAADQKGNVFIWVDGQFLKMGPDGQILAAYGSKAATASSADGTAIQNARISSWGVAIDGSGNIVYNETNRVRRINFTTGVLETVGGLGARILGDNGPAIATNFTGASDIAFLPSGDLLIGDGLRGIRKLDANGNISTYAAGATPSPKYAFEVPFGIEPDGAGNVYVADMYSVYRIDAKGQVSLVAGLSVANDVCGYTGDGGPATSALLCEPYDLALDAAGNLFIADTNNNRIRRVDALTGVITTVAGSGPVNGFEKYLLNGSYSGDGGPAIQACINTPFGVAFDAQGNLYIGDGGNNGNGRFRKVDTAGTITTFAANLGSTPNKLVFDTVGYAYAPSFFGVLRFDAAGNATKIAGQLPQGFSGDGGPALLAQTRTDGFAVGIAVDAEGNVYFDDAGNLRVRAIRYGALLAPPAITRQPVGPRVTAGQPAIFAVAATGFPAPSYQWKKDGVDISGATGATYTIASAQISDGSNYSVVITNVMGSTTSSFAKIAVVAEPTSPSIAAPPASQTATAGGTVTFTILANGIAPLNYQWSKGGVTIAGATTATLTLTNVQVGDARSYNVSVSNGTGSITSIPATLTVNVPPTITTQPVSRSVAAGVGTTFSVSAIGTGTLSYQWRKDGAPIAGATSATLTLNGTQPGDAGSYTVVVSGIAGSVTSSSATLTINVPPTITTQPVSRSVVAGIGAIFSVSATGTGTLSYQWRKDGVPIVGATGATLSLPSVTVGDAGNYTVVITNSAGSIESAAAVLTVTVPNPGRLINLSVLTSIASGENFTVGTVLGGADTSGTKPLLVRAVGPTLGAAPFNVPGVLADPKLDLFSGTTIVASNDDWGGGAALVAANAQVGAFPFVSATSKDAAVVYSADASAPPVSFTMQVGGNAGTAGTVLAEIYDSTPAASVTTTMPRLINVSVLKPIGTGLTAGFVIGGATPLKVLIRVIGPSLSLFNVSGAIADPKLELFDSASKSIATNDDWGGTAPLNAAFNQVGAFLLGATTKDAALLATLNPGNYTVQATPSTGGSGIALVEIYEVPL
jgi:sugar lactone lactonase YvrE